MEGEFVVFLIGMRVNKPWMVGKWLPVKKAMKRMLGELLKNPASGLLGFESAIYNRTSIIVQYWESFEKLEAYARARDKQHFPAWIEFYKRVGNTGAVGLWHETYKIQPQGYEAIYYNMPPYGLGKIGKLVPAKGRHESARDRINEK